MTLRFFRMALCFSVVAASGCSTMGGRSSVESLGPESVDASKFRSVVVSVRSDVPGATDEMDLVRTAFSHRLHFPTGAPGNNGKDLVVDVDLVEVGNPSGFSRIMVGAMSGPDLLTATVTAKSGGVTLSKFKVRAEQNNGIRGGMSNAAARVANETLDKLGLPRERDDSR